MNQVGQVDFLAHLLGQYYKERESSLPEHDKVALESFYQFTTDYLCKNPPVTTSFAHEMPVVMLTDRTVVSLAPMTNYEPDSSGVVHITNQNMEVEAWRSQYPKPKEEKAIAVFGNPNDVAPAPIIRK